MQKIKDIAFSLRQQYSYGPHEQVQKVFDEVDHLNSIVLPITLLDRIAEMSFDM